MVNGILISTARLQPFIVTLATWSIWGGVAFWLLPVEGGAPSTDLVSWVLGDLLGVPEIGLGSRRCSSLLWFWLRPTRFITDLIAIGSDEARARLLGVHLVGESCRPTRSRPCSPPSPASG